MNTKEIILPEGWEIDKVENNKIILKESKKELPKTWDECANILSRRVCERIDSDGSIKPVYESSVWIVCKNLLPLKLGKPMLALHQLLVCREVYRQGWKPNWFDETEKYCIGCYTNNIDIFVAIGTNQILSFQSKEIRDKFLENFRDLIEEAKELI